VMRWGAAVTCSAKRCNCSVVVVRCADRVQQDATCNVRELLARELTLSVQARKSRAFRTPLIRPSNYAAAPDILVFGGTWSAQK
jgi:hypothetical protein